MREFLSQRLCVAEVRKLSSRVQGDPDQTEALYRLTSDSDNRVAFNALWAFTLFSKANRGWLYKRHDDLINRVLVEPDITKCRLMLTLLSCQPFGVENLRTDFIDFCLAKVTACAQPHAVRVLCMKLAYEQMKFYLDLLTELEVALDMLEQETLPPSLASAKRQVEEKIALRARE